MSDIELPFRATTNEACAWPAQQTGSPWSLARLLENGLTPVEIRIEDLTELDKAWSKLGTIEAHKQWSKDLEPNVVSATHRWKVYRII